MLRGSLRLAATAAWYTLVVADFSIIPPGLLTNSSEAVLSSGCVSSMQTSIRCNQYFQYSVSIDNYGYLDPSVLDTLCTASCATDLSTYHSSVVSSCAADPYPWDGTPAQHYGDQVWASYNMTCLKDGSSGTYCQNYFANLTLSGDLSITDLPAAQACSPCMLALGQMIQATSYSNYDTRMAVVWANLQKQCGVTYPTAVQPIVGNRTDLPGYAPSGYPIATCLSGKTYTVVSGDSCSKIATAMSVPRGSLQAINNVLPSCSDLQVGQVLCLPQPCMLYTIQSGDTCYSISNTTSLSITQLRAWNPFINPLCTNLLLGDGICINQPGAVWSGTTIPGATVTKTAIYATATVVPPGIVAHGTTPYCGKYYNVKSGDYCQIIAVNNTITISLFQAINPDVNANCTNLNVGLYYCVEPTADWNTTSTNTTTTTLSYVTAPAPTPTGTTSRCFQYYTVVSGDYCAKIEAAFSITMAQLQLWNPNLLSDCSNLVLGDAYCVSGDSSSSPTTNPSSSHTSTTSSSPTSASYVTPGAPTPSGTTSQCYQYYTVVSGDYCAKIEAAFSITMTQLQAWNPNLLSDCSNLLLGDAYCVQGAAASASKRALAAEAVSSG